MSDGGPFLHSEYASPSSVLPLISPAPFLSPLALSSRLLPLTPLHCKIHPYSPLQQPNCAHYLLSVQNC